MLENSHYRQILINLSVKDSTPDSKIKDLRDKIEEFVKNQDLDYIEELKIVVN